MAKVGFVFSESEARQILGLINEKIASLFCQKPKEVHFVFLSHISSRGKGEVVVGQCVHLDMYDEIQVIVRPGWQNTAIHELVHSYNPVASEKVVRKTTNDIVRYFKGWVS